MEMYNTSERNIQIVLYLLKAHKIKKVIASPGSTDVAIVSSMQHDSFFEMFSCIDERSACYMACGLSAESKEPVVIVCTGATSSRNYLPGLTEAYYRHLPILAITCSRSNSCIGHYMNQITDRGNAPSDTVNISVQVPSIHSSLDEWNCMINTNRAILGLRFNGGGPCHINLETEYSRDFSVKTIPPTRIINRYTVSDELPSLPEGKIGIFVGNFLSWDKKLEDVVDRFCEQHNAVVFYDHSSNYKGKYGVLFPLIASQPDYGKGIFDIDLMIHIGYISASTCMGRKVWRVNIDGEIRDTFRKLVAVFQMSEYDFFKYYIDEDDNTINTTLHASFYYLYQSLYKAIPELPFSNLWVAKQLAPKIPENSVMHFGILNSLRSWNNFELSKTIRTYSNTGGFGIDGGVSSLVGASFADRNKLYFGVVGDLLFYYDMNSLGNRDIAPNLRLLVINNGLGQEFKNKTSFGAIFKEDTNRYIAAEGHFGGRNYPVIESYVKSLGFEYISASTSEEFTQIYEEFVNPVIGKKPMVFEVFTESEDESNALELITALTRKGKMLNKKDELLRNENVQIIKTLVKKMIKNS